MAKSSGVANPTACATGITGVTGTWSHLRPSPVIASEAKQSIARHNGWVDCFVASLRAMTVDRYDIAFSRRDAPGVLRSFRPMKIRGRRECRMHAAPAVSCAMCVEMLHMSIQVQRRPSDIPCAMVLRLMLCSPRRRILFCHRRQRIKADRARSGRLHLRQLDISNGCQVHTVLPYAAIRLRQEASPDMPIFA